MKKLKVDVETSLGFQENGRLMPASKTEYSNEYIKVFVCPECNYELKLEHVDFGDETLCPKCGAKMIQRIKK
jgi:predicted RNA-binding Zn-ribbon protein involved in translation (DUF1610 family)